MSISRYALGAKALEAVVTIATTLGVSALASRYLEAEARGLFFLVLTWTSISLALVSIDGLAIVLTRECTQRPQEIARIISSGSALQFSLVLIWGALLLSLFQLHPHFSAYRTELSVSLLVALAGSCAVPLEALLLSANRVPLVALARTAAQVLSFAIFTYSITHMAPIALSAGARSLVGFIGAGFLALAIWRRFAGALMRPHLGELRHLALQTLPITLIWLATLLYVRVDTLMLEVMVSRESVGQYAALYQILDSLMVLSGFLMSAYFPVFSRSATQDISEFKDLFHNSISLLVRWLVPIAALIAIAAKPIEALLLNQDTTEGPWIIRWLMLAAVFAWLNGASGSVLIALKRQHLYTLATILSLLVNVGGNLLLIPGYGPVGAAAATALTEMFLVCVAWTLIYRNIGYVPFLCRSQSRAA